MKPLVIKEKIEQRPDVLDEVVLVTNLPYHIYAEEILEYKNRTWNT